MDHSAAAKQRMASKQANAAKIRSPAPRGATFRRNGGLCWPRDVRVGDFTIGTTVQTFDVGMPAPMPRRSSPQPLVE
jgi:hypothetical protein